MMYIWATAFPGDDRPIVSTHGYGTPRVLLVLRAAGLAIAVLGAGRLLSERFFSG